MKRACLQWLGCAVVTLAVAGCGSDSPTPASPGGATPAPAAPATIPLPTGTDLDGLLDATHRVDLQRVEVTFDLFPTCLLYTSDAADDN